MPLPPCPSASLKQRVTCWLPLDRGTDTSVMISVQSTDVSKAHPAGLRHGSALEELIQPPERLQARGTLAGTQHARQVGAHRGRPLGTCTGSELSGGGRLPNTAITNPRTRAATQVRHQLCAQHCMHITSFNPPVQTHQAGVVSLT